jgi:hypothetical protein
VNENNAKSEPDQTKPTEKNLDGKEVDEKKPDEKNLDANESRQEADGRTNPAQGRSQVSSFDWVTERSSCSLPKVFNVLRLQVEEDVKTRNALRPNYSPYEFSLIEDTEEFKVLLKAKELQQAVTFSLGDRAIQVHDGQDNKMFEVTASFDDTGKCRLQVNAEDRDFWQVRRMALEDLMFRGL